MLSLDAFSKAHSVRPGSTRTRWGSFSAPLDLLAAIVGGVLLLRWKGGKGRRKKRKREGEEEKKAEG